MSIKSLDEGKLNLFNHYWENSADNMFLATLDEDIGDFIVEEINPSQQKDLGIEEDIKHKKIKDLIGNEKAKDLKEKYLKCLENRTPMMEDETIEINGEKKFYNTMIIPVNDQATGQKHIIGISRDLTDIINTKEKLQKLSKEIDTLTNEKNNNFEETQNNIKMLAFNDPLTGIGNRRYLNDHAIKTISLAHRYDSCLTFMVLDIDNLNEINKKHGHTFGDTVIKEIAELLKASIRESDILSRYSGEEFLLLLPMTSLEAAQILGERLLDKVRALDFSTYDKFEVSITASIGISALNEPQDNLDILLQKTYNALDKAKEYGKNQMVSYISESSYKIHT